MKKTTLYLKGGSRENPDLAVRKDQLDADQETQKKPKSKARKDQLDADKETRKNPDLTVEEARLYFDGGSRGNLGLAAGGAVLKINDEQYEVRQLLDDGTCNEAEYIGLIAGLKLAIQHNVTHVKIYGDSKLVIQQIHRHWACRQAHLQLLLEEATALLQEFSSYEISWIPREKNSEADALCNQAMDGAEGKKSTTTLADVPLPEPLPKLAEQIRSFNQNSHQKSFKSFMKLKSGCDQFSRKKLEVLQNMTPPEVREILESTDLDDEFLAQAYRWYWRGLHPDLALRKVNISREMAAKAIGADLKSYGLRNPKTAETHDIPES